MAIFLWQPVQVDSQPKSSGLVLGRRPLGAILHSSNEPGELSQWLCHDDSTINIVVVIIIIINDWSRMMVESGWRLQRPYVMKTTVVEDEAAVGTRRKLREYDGDMI